MAGSFTKIFLPTAIVPVAKYYDTSRRIKKIFTKKTHHGNQYLHLLKFKIQQLKRFGSVTFEVPLKI